RGAPTRGQPFGERLPAIARPGGRAEKTRMTPNGVRFCLRIRVVSPRIGARFPTVWVYWYGQGVRQRHRRQPVTPLAADPRRPGGLGGLRPALRPADFPVVPAVATPGGGRGGRDPERPADPRGETARVRVRPERPLPRLAEDRRPPRLGQI